MTQTAELFVVDEFVDCRVVAAHGAIGIAAQLERIDFHGERIEVHQAANQSLTFIQDDLDRFQRFDHAN